jgi:hypothetical protein
VQGAGRRGGGSRESSPSPCAGQIRPKCCYSKTEELAGSGNFQAWEEIAQQLYSITRPSKKFREQFGHTPVSVEERIPWKCRRLVVGTGRYGSLPVMDEVKREARSRKIELVILPTDEAIKILAKRTEETNAILHVTC